MKNFLKNYYEKLKKVIGQTEDSNNDSKNDIKDIEKVTVNKKRSKTKAYLIFCIGLVLLILTSGLFNGNTSNKKANVNSESKIQTQKTEYIRDLEKRMASILSNVDGAGRVEVLITLKAGPEKVIANEFKKTSDKSDYRNSSEKCIKEEFIKPQIINKNGRDENPIVIKEIEPIIEGVLIVSSGANNRQVNEQLYKAALALLNVQSHKIQILSHKK